MKLEILNRNENPMLKRIEVEARITFESGTPKKDDVKKIVAQAIKCDEKLTAIKHVYSDFGKKEAKIKAYCYQDEASFKLLEGVEEKEAPKEGEAAQPAETPKEEKKVEAKT